MAFLFLVVLRTFYSVRSWVLLGFTVFFSGFNGFHWIALNSTRFYLVLVSFTGFYRVLLGFTGSYWVLPSFLWILLDFSGSYWVIMGYHGL